MNTKLIVGGLAILVLAVEGAFLLRANPSPANPQEIQTQAPTGTATGSGTSATPRQVSLSSSTTTPSVGPPVVSPSIITVNIPTVVTVMATITDPTLIAGSANLLRLGATGTQPTILGAMHDDGLNGDAAANDGIYTFQVPFNETVAGQIQLEISAAFKGRLNRVLSAQGSLAVWNSYDFHATLGISLLVPPTYVVNNTADSLYFTNGDVEVMELATSTLPSGTSLLQYALSDIANNACPAVDDNNQPVDHVLSNTGGSVMYVLSCTASTDDYNYIIVNSSGDVVKLTYHDDFDPTVSVAQQIATFQMIVGSVH
jgi:hypothetical protein